MSIERISTQTRREQITETALNVIANQGVGSLSMAVLARRIGLVPSAIYRHFDSKDKVLDSVVDLLQKKLLGNVAIVRKEGTDHLNQLKRLLALHVRLILEHQALPRLIFSGDIYYGQPERRKKIFKIVEKYLHEVASIIREGQRQGRINPDLDPDMLSVVFLGLIQPAAILWHLSDGKFDAGKQVEKAWPFFHDAVKARKQTETLT
ncbi:MAG TPA: TetR/AcrR family transcriptional regulator [Syntrophobacteraceae bacterium]|nr:TetR/AcrR family transcriptional regulator [Syntrophobacteraceae bacterium]